MKMKQTPAIILELDATARHRVVLLSPDGTNRAGAWTSVTEVAELEGKFFGCTAHAILPPGVWTLREVPHQVLT